ncbi:MAG: hypothetical protein AAB967_01935 [Patescibacteria group bacterium]
MKKIILTLGIILILVVAGLTWLLLQFGRPDALKASPYSAVYLTTGDIYFGRLSWFPSPRMKNVWLLQRGVDEQNQPRFSFVPFSSAFWSPIDKIYLNPKQIMFWTRLKKGSDAANALENPAALGPPPAASSAQQGQSPALLPAEQ